MYNSKTITALLASTMLVPTSGWAQDASDAGEFIGTVTVGESRRGVQTDTAASETIINQDEIEERQATTTGELLDTIPNVSLLNGSTPQGAGISIRGLGSQAGTYGNDGSVSIIIDGVTSGSEEIYRNGAALSLEPELFKELKVTRGPANGFRYSSSAVGGTIEASTKDATDFLEDGDTFSFRQKFGFESNGDGLLSTSILSFAPNDQFDALLFVGRRDVGNRTAGNGTRLGGTEFRQSAALVKLNYALNDEHKVTFGYVYGEIPQRDVPYNVYDASRATFGTVDRDTVDHTAYLEHNYNPLDNDLVDLTVRLQYKKEEISLNPVNNRFGISLLEADHETKTRSIRATNVSRFSLGGTNHTLTVGVEGGERERSSITDSGLNDRSAPGGTDRYGALYLVDEIEFGDRLVLTPQVRYEAQRLTSQNNAAVPNGSRYPDESFVGGISALYNVTDSFAVFGTVAWNENLPILDDLGSSRIDITETARTYELGVSYDGFDVFTADDSLKAKLTGFVTEIRNGRTYSAGSDASRRALYIDGVDIDGLEFEMSYVHPQFYVDFNVARNRASVTSVTGASTTDFVGDPFRYSSPDSAKLNVGKRFMDNQLNLNAGIRHTAAMTRTTRTSGATAPTSAYTLYDISASYTPKSGNFEGVEFRAAVENLFDKDYRQYGSSRLGTGRNIKVSVAKTF